MRAAALSHGSPDYLIDIVIDGLIDVLGRDQVHLDLCIGPANWDARVPHLFARCEGFNSFAAADADVLIASVRSDPQIIDEWKRTSGRQAVAIIDGEDDEVIRESFLRRAVVYFKREFMAGVSYPVNVRPLPFAAIPESRIAIGPRARPVFFHANDTHALRCDVKRELRSLGHQVSGGLIPKAEYNQLIASALICPSVRGAGWDTYRYWEIPFLGSVLLSQRLPIVIPNDFVEGEEAVRFDTVSDFRSRLQWLLEHPDAAEEIARAGHAKCMTAHLSAHRAATVMDALT